MSDAEGTAHEAQAQWWPSAHGALFGWTHYPTKDWRSTAVVIVPPIGPEYLHSHRAVRHLARCVAQEGYPCIRFDHLGYGDSADLAIESDALPAWRVGAAKAVEVALALPGVQRVVLVALRSGSLLVDAATAARVAGLGLWYPYLRGNAFVRDLQVLDAALELPATDGSYLEAGGYPMGRATADALGGCDLMSEWTSVPSHALLITEAGLPPNRRTADALAQRGCSTLAERQLGGRPTMMRQAELMDVPLEDVEAIRSWLIETFPESGAGAVPARASVGFETPAWRERTLWLAGASPTFAVVTEPTQRHEGWPALVLLNAGSAHHVGPNGLHTTLARTAAAAGWVVVRLDIPGLGESSSRVERDTHHPYPATIASAMSPVLDALSEQLATPVVLSGLCSGAHNSYQAALAAQSGRVAGLVLLNPLTLYFQPGDDILMPAASRTQADAQSYSENSRDLRKWIGLLTDPLRAVRVVRGVAGVVATRIAERSLAIGRKVGVMSPVPLVRDLQRLLRGGTRIHLLTSRSEPGYQAIRDVAPQLISESADEQQVALRILSATDHTFTQRRSRDELIRDILHSLETIAK